MRHAAISSLLSWHICQYDGLHTYVLRMLSVGATAVADLLKVWTLFNSIVTNSNSSMV